MGRGHPYDFHARRPPRLHPGLGVLKHHAPGGRHFQPASNLEKDIRRRLAPLDMLRRHRRVEKIFQAELSQPEPHVLLFRGRSDAAGNPGLRQPIQPRTHPRQRGDAPCLHHLPVEFLLPPAEAVDFLPIMRPPEHVPHDLDVPPAESLPEVSGRQRLSGFLGQTLPALLVVAGTVQNHPVPIEDRRPGRLHPPDARTSRRLRPAQKPQLTL